MVDIHLRKLLWVYCPGHAGVNGNDQADSLAGKATLISGLLLERSEVLRSLRHYLRAQSQGHHTTDRLEERGVERGSVRRSFLKGRERAIVSQTNIGTVSKASFGKLLRDVVECMWASPSLSDTILKVWKFWLENVYNSMEHFETKSLSLIFISSSCSSSTQHVLSIN